MKQTFKDVFSTIITNDLEKKEFISQIQSIKSPDSSNARTITNNKKSLNSL